MRKRPFRTNHTPTDEGTIRTNYGLLYAHERSIHESPLQTNGGYALSRTFSSYPTATRERKIKSAVGEDSISSRKPTHRTNCTPTDERAIRTNYGLLYAHGRGIHECHLQMVGGSRTIPTATAPHPSQNHNSPVANYITFPFRKTYHIFFRKYITCATRTYHCAAGTFPPRLRATVRTPFLI